MISFRYHLVSLIGVFLAIALGVVIGTSALNGAVLGDLRRQVADLKRQRDRRVPEQRSPGAGGQRGPAGEDLRCEIAGRALSKQRWCSSARPVPARPAALSQQVAAAGGTSSGELQLAKAFLDPRRAADIQTLATSGAHPVGLQLPTTDSPGLLAGALLGYVLLGHGQGTDLTQVLAGFATLNMLKWTAPRCTRRRGGLVAPGGLPKNDQGGAMLLAMATEIGSLAARP